jgi:hypothetical protein
LPTVHPAIGAANVILPLRETSPKQAYGRVICIRVSLSEVSWFIRIIVLPVTDGILVYQFFAQWKHRLHGFWMKVTDRLIGLPFFPMPFDTFASIASCLLVVVILVPPFFAYLFCNSSMRTRTDLLEAIGLILAPRLLITSTHLISFWL